MAKKIFLSVLGNSKYGECCYEFKGFVSPQTKFIQIATLEYFRVQKITMDKHIIFVTDGEKGSYTKNWKDSVDEIRTTHKRQNWWQKKLNCYQEKTVVTKNNYLGLETLLKKGNFQNYSSCFIPEGKNNTEIWSIFNEMMSQFEGGEELYIDVTHGFRYLPMLMLLLCNYANLVKGVKIKSITYGTFTPNNGMKREQIVDLIEFQNLQEWVLLANIFDKTGRTKNILERISSEENKAIEDFSDNIYLIKGKKIIENKSVDNLKSALSKLSSSPEPFKQIQKKIENSIKLYQNHDVRNLFVAVQYCVTFNLLQQGFTLLHEAVITYILTRKHGFDNNVWNVYENREALGFYIKIRGNVEQSKKNEVAAAAYSYLSSQDRVELSKIFQKITDLRNAMNHAGMSTGSIDKDITKERLADALKTVKNIFNIQ